jgi:DNA repair exonuclease SbcCD ATPase subunit/predicted phosphodiesterase
MEDMRKENVEVVICTGDIYHTKTQNISPEFIDKLAWMITTISDEFPLYMILGNHDGNLNNADRQDAISPINNLLNRPNVHLLKTSGNYKVEGDPRIRLGVLSPFDKEGWSKVKPLSGAINVVLFHGSVYGCVMDNGYKLPEAEAQPSLFNDWDFAFLGDIHKSQFLGSRKDYKGAVKPWMGYSGSLIQQSHGEDLEKGWLLWDIRAGDDWDVEFKKIENPWRYVDVLWQGTIIDTLNEMRAQVGEGIKELRLRVVVSDGEVSRAVRDLFVKSAKKLYPISGVSFKQSKIRNLQDSTMSAGSAGNLRNTPEPFLALLRDYFAKFDYVLTPEQVVEINKMATAYLKSVVDAEPKDGRGIEWSLMKLEFDNLYAYGASNSMDYEHKTGIIGIDGPNQVGKSSIIGALMFALYGTSDRGPVKTSYIVNNSSKAGSAKVEIMVAGGTRYVFERKATKGSKKGQVDEEKATSTLSITKVSTTGESENVKETEDSITDSDKAIKEIIGSPQDLLQTSISTQGNLAQLIQLGPTDRKTFLNKILDFDLIEKVGRLVNNDATNLAAKTRGISPEDIQVTLAQTIGKLKICDTVISEINKESSLNDSFLLEEKVWFEGHKARLNQLRSEEQRRARLTQEKLRLESALEAAISAKEKAVVDAAQRLKELEKAEIDFASFENLSQLTEELSNLTAKQSSSKIDSSVVERDIVESRKGLKVLAEVPCGGDLQSVCKFVSGAKKNAEALPLLEEKQTKIQQKLQELQETLLTLSKNINHGSSLQKARDTLQRQCNDLENKILHLEETADSARNTLRLTQEALDSCLVVDAAELEQAREREVVLNDLVAHQKSLSADLLKEVSAKGSLQARVQSLETELEQTILHRDKMKLLELLQGAVSKNGIPAMVLERQLPLVNDHINNVLAGVVDFKVFLETTVGSNTLNIYLQEGETKRVIEVCCGMEQTIASIAIRVALLSLTTLPKPDFFILDEAFGPLDPSNLAKCSNLLTSLKDRFKMVIMVTHIQAMKEIMDDVVEVTSARDGFSHVSYK